MTMTNHHQAGVPFSYLITCIWLHLLINKRFPYRCCSHRQRLVSSRLATRPSLLELQTVATVLTS
jgi:hypothetical protein